MLQALLAPPVPTRTAAHGLGDRIRVGAELLLRARAALRGTEGLEPPS